MAVSGLSFAAQVDAWVRQTEQRMTAVFRESAQEVVATMQSAVRVDTGFLRASLQVNVNGGPVPANRPNPGGPVTATVATLAIAGADIGDTIYATYSASYAPHVEYGTSKMQGRGFVRTAAAQWPAIVSRTAAQARASVRARQ